jgi:TolA-binding protein
MGVTTTLLVLGLVTVLSLAAYLGGRQLLGDDPGSRDLHQRLDALCRQVVAWQAAHDHQVASLDRRLRDVEIAAARAEEEARIVSVQMAELTQGLCQRLEQVEQRNEIERLAAEGRLRW